MAGGCLSGSSGAHHPPWRGWAGDCAGPLGYADTSGLSASLRASGVTNIRNTRSPHWQRWLGVEHRCLVPLSAFSEPGRDRKPVWFEMKDRNPMFLAGIEVRSWKSIRKVKDGETVDDLFGFLTCPPNAEVGAVHPKAMPVVLTNADEWHAWMTLPWEQARVLQRPLADGVLVVAQQPTV